MVTALLQYTDGRMTPLTAALRDYAKAPKNRIKYSETLECLSFSKRRNLHSNAGVSNCRYMKNQ